MIFGKRYRRGVTATGYGLLVGLIGIVALGVVTTTGGQIETLFCTVGNKLVGQEACSGAAQADDLPGPLFATGNGSIPGGPLVAGGDFESQIVFTYPGIEYAFRTRPNWANLSGNNLSGTVPQQQEEDEEVIIDARNAAGNVVGSLTLQLPVEENEEPRITSPRQLNMQDGQFLSLQLAAEDENERHAAGGLRFGSDGSNPPPPWIQISEDGQVSSTRPLNSGDHGEIIYICVIDPLVEVCDSFVVWLGGQGEAFIATSGGDAVLDPLPGSCTDVTITNIGDGQATGISAPTLSGPDADRFGFCQPSGTVCGSTLNPGASCTVGVRALLSQTGAFDGIVTVTASNAPIPAAKGLRVTVTNAIVHSYATWRLRATAVAPRWYILESEWLDASGTDQSIYVNSSNHCAFASRSDSLDPVHGFVNNWVSTSAGAGWEAGPNGPNIVGDFIGCDFGSPETTLTLRLYVAPPNFPPVVLEGASSPAGPYTTIATLPAPRTGGWIEIPIQ